MIQLNTPAKLPNTYIWYVFVKLGLVLFLISFLGGLENWAGHFLGALISLGLPIGLYLLLRITAISFQVDDGKITINSGILIKNSRSLSFDRVQNVNNVSGVLARIFGLARVSIWTASPSQIQIRSDGVSSNKPDVSLYLEKESASWLREFITSKPKS